MAKAADKAKKNSAFMKPVRPSEHLAKIVGTEPLPRKLQPIFGAKKMDMFQMTKAVNKHLK
jgi:chromatin remodeling complex protein RSC6